MTRRGWRAITILSGFLGSGKTTLLRRYLAEQARGDIHVIPRSRDNPERRWVYDTKVVGDLIAVGAPVPRHVVA